MKGYQFKVCRGPRDCPHRALDDSGLAASVEELLRGRFPEGGPEARIPAHERCKISLSFCANGCSQPQIADIGFLGACVPGPTEKACVDCARCAKVCPERALAMRTEGVGPVMDPSLCVACGACVRACPTGSLACAATGFRVLLGGRLGRHPRLGRELDGLASSEQVLEIVRQALDLPGSLPDGEARQGERLADLIHRLGWTPDVALAPRPEPAA